MKAIRDVRDYLNMSTNNAETFKVYMFIPTRSMSNESALVYEVASHCTANNMRVTMGYITECIALFKKLGLLKDNARLEMLETITTLSYLTGTN